MKLESQSGQIQVHLNFAREVVDNNLSQKTEAGASGVDARTYLDEHRVLEWLQDVMTSLLRDRPTNPWEYIANSAYMKDSMGSRISNAADWASIPSPSGEKLRTESFAKSSQHVGQPCHDSTSHEEQTRAAMSALLHERPRCNTPMPTQQRSEDQAEGQVKAQALNAAGEIRAASKVLQKACSTEDFPQSSVSPGQDKFPVEQDMSPMLEANLAAESSAGPVTLEQNSQIRAASKILQKACSSGAAESLIEHGSSISSSYPQLHPHAPCIHDAPIGLMSPVSPAGLSIAAPPNGSAPSAIVRPPKAPSGHSVFNPRVPAVDPALSRPRSLPSLGSPNKSQVRSANLNAASCASSVPELPQLFAGGVSDEVGSFGDETRVRELLGRVVDSGRISASGHNSPAGSAHSAALS